MIQKTVRMIILVLVCSIHTIFLKIFKEALITWRELLRQENYKWIKEIVERSKIMGYWREETGKNNFFGDESKQVARISTKTTLMKFETVELTKKFG